MKDTVFSADQVFDGDRLGPGWLVVEGGRVAAVASASAKGGSETP